MSMTTIYTSHSVEETLVMKSKLEFYGIQVCFIEEYAARCKWVYLNGSSGCHLQVPSSDAEFAHDILAERLDKGEGELEPAKSHRAKIVISALILSSLGPFAAIFIAIILWAKLEQIFKSRRQLRSFRS
jgi:hypothetical protein